VALVAAAQGDLLHLVVQLLHQVKAMLVVVQVVVAVIIMAVVAAVRVRLERLALTA
jgi:hypothetical protein